MNSKQEKNIPMALDSTSNMWSRIIMDRATYKMMCVLDFRNFNVLELSGDKWRNFGFKSYKSLFYPEFDICEDVLDEKFDLIIAEQVFEHLLYPYRAAKNINAMLKNGGYFLNTSPFLVKYHPEPNDCTRWTETGMKYFLSECGFPLEKILTGSWGNLDCALANFGPNWILFNETRHSLENNPKLPIHIWVLAEKQFSFLLWFEGLITKKKRIKKVSMKAQLYKEKLKFAVFSPIKFIKKYYKILEDIIK